MALVDERLSTKERRLPFGLSNNLCLASPSPSSQEGGARLFKMAAASVYSVGSDGARSEVLKL